MKTLLAVLQLSLLSQVPAQEPKQAPAPASEKKKVQVFDFEDTVIESEPQGPQVEFFWEHEGRTRHPLVRIRENFDDKVMQSVGEM